MSVRVLVKNFQSIREADVEIAGFTVVTGANNTGKALQHGTLVATPRGWRRVEDLIMGDMVLAGDGSPTAILGVYPQGERPVWRVRFDDGRHLDVDADHLWQVSIGSKRFHRGLGQQWELLTTAQVIKRVGSKPKGWSKPAIPVAGPALYESVPTPLDPYLLGVLLGDGCIQPTSIRLSTKDSELVKFVRGILPETVHLRKVGGCDYGLRVGRGYTNPVLTALRQMDLIQCSWDKFIPSEYKYNSVSVRLAVLQGLMDTDGWVLVRDGSAGFSSASKRLSDDVVEIVQSLGGTARSRSRETFHTREGLRLRGRTVHTVCLRAPSFDLFRLSRKLNVVKPLARRVNGLMTSFASMGQADCTCIQIAHPSGLFQVQGHLVTHNTALQRAIRGVFQNTPGTTFIREGETTCEVTVDFGDRRVTWSKGTGKKDRPTYVLDKGEPIYPGQGVPEEVAALGVIPIQAGGQEVWPTIAPQFSGQLFLVDKPGSAVAEAVADVERVGQLNRALRNAESDRRTAASTLKVRVADLTAFEAQVAKFDGLDEAVVAVQALEEVQAGVQRIGRAALGLMALRDRLRTAEKMVGTLALVGDIQTPDPRPVQELQGGLRELGKLRQRLSKTQQEVQRYSGTDTLLVSVDESTSRRLLDGFKVLKMFRTRRIAAVDRVAAIQIELGQAEDELIQATAEANAALAELGCCPTCGTEVKS